MKKTEPTTPKTPARNAPAQGSPAAHDPRWNAVVARDARTDGQFVYAVTTTGIYCRPTCPSRRAKVENVLLFDSPREAERAGFRPCLRCAPDRENPERRLAKTMEALCRHIETMEHAPTLAELAVHCGLSQHHLQRTFKRLVGVTPKAYAAGHRQRRIRRELRETQTITEAVFAAGYNTGSRFYAESDDLLGMTATAYRSGAPGLPIRFAFGKSSLGTVLVARSERSVCAVLLGDDTETLESELRSMFPHAEPTPEDEDFACVVAAVIQAVEEPVSVPDLPLDIRGTVFQQRVWTELRRIPVGETASYTDIAQRLGMSRNARAVGGACAANRLAVLIPCHRVLRKDGDPAGYRWGEERKRTLLARESDD